MSKTVDERVVSMRFDNEHFERNVQQSMSTIDKLKMKLKFKGATDGLNDVNKAAGKVNLSPLGQACDKVGLKFNAMYTIADQALRNITNSAYYAGKRIVQSLTIDPVKTGLSEYETQINAIQTILANTESKGTTLDDVNGALDELNAYADKTIYNFTEMTRNIGTFTAAGVDLDTSVSAIKGIANLAAVSGSTSQQASTAMYQLSQALASGTVKLMDWNSVVNAGMGGQVFQDALKETARVHGVAIDSMIEKEGSFRETLHNGWLTAEILTETLSKFTGDLTEDQLKSMGYTEEQIDGILKMGKTANDAATKVKTFTQLLDTLKEAAQSGWAQTWEILIGDFEKAKELWSGVSDVFSTMISNSAEARNTFLGGVMNLADPWTKITEKLGAVKKVADTVTKATDKLTEFQDIVNKVWRGDFGNSDTGRFEALEKLGYDHRVIQDLTNKGHLYQLTVEDIEESHKKFGLTFNKTAAETAVSADKTATSFGNLSDEQLKNAGLTETEIRLYRDLEKEAKRTGKSVDELVDEMSKNDGRTMLLNSLANIGNGLLGVFKALKDAWKEIFPGPSVVQVYNLIKGFEQFTEKLRLTNKETGELTETGDKLRRIFKGVFAVLDIFFSLFGSVFKIVFKAADALLGAFNLDLLGLLANVADAIVKFRDWIKALDPITVVFTKIGEGLKWLVDKVKEFFNSTPEIGEFGKNIIQGLANGLKSGAKAIAKAVINLGNIVIDTFKKLLGIHSPSTVFFEFGENIIEGLVNGLKKALSLLGRVIKTIIDFIRDGLDSRAFDKLLDFPSLFFEKGKALLTSLCDGISAGFIIVGKALKKVTKFITDNFDLDKILSIASTTALVIFAVKFAKFIGVITQPLSSFADLMDSFSDAVDVFANGYKKLTNGLAFNLKTKGLMNIATAIAILAGSIIALTVVLDIYGPKVWEAVGVVAVLTLLVAGLMLLMRKASNLQVPAKTSLAFAALGFMMVMLAGAIAIIAGISVGDAIKASLVVTLLMGLVIALTKFAAAADEKSIKHAGKIVSRMGRTLLLIAGAMLILGLLSPETMLKGVFIFGMLGAMAAALTLVSKFSNNVEGAANVIKHIGTSMFLMSLAIAIIGLVKWENLFKAIIGIGALSLFIVGLIAATRLAGTNREKLGMTILALSGAMLMLSAALVIIGLMSWNALMRGIVGMGALTVFISGLILATKLAGKERDKIGRTMLAISGAMLMLSAAFAIMASISIGGLLKGMIAVTGIGALMLGLVLLCKNDKDISKVGGVILKFGAAMFMIAAAMKIIATMDFVDMAKALGAVLAIGALFGGLILIAKNATAMNDNAKSIKGVLITLTVLVAVIAVAIAGLSFIEPAKLALATASIGSIMGLFALLIKMTTTLKTGPKEFSRTAITLGILVGVIAALGGVIYGLSSLNPDRALGASLSLSMLLLALAGAMRIIQDGKAFSKSFTQTLITLGILTAVVGGLAVVIGLLAATKPAYAVESAKALSILLLAMSGALNILGKTKKVNKGVLPQLAILIAVSAGLGLLLAGLDGLNPVSAIGTAVALSTLLIALSGALFILQTVKTVSPIALIALGAMTLVVGLMGGLLYLLNDLDPGTSIGVAIALSTLALALSASCLILGAVGAIAVSAIAGVAVLAILVAALGGLIIGIGALVDKFPQLETFLDKGIPILEKIGYALGSFVGNIIGGFLGGMSSGLPEIGRNLSNFMKEADYFIEGASKIDSSAVDGVKSLVETIMLLSAANFVERLATIGQIFNKESSIEKFAKELPKLGKGLMDFSDSTSGINADSVTAAADAAKALGDMAADIPKVGGLVEAFAGSSGVEAFSAQLPALGSGLKSFSDNVAGIDTESVKAASGAAKSIAEMTNHIPNESGVISWFTGQNNLSKFAGNLVPLGEGLKGFNDAIAGINPENIKAAAKAGESIAEMTNHIPNESGVISWFTGNNNLSKFAGNLVPLGEGLYGFSSAVAGIVPENVKAAAEAGKALASMTKIIPPQSGIKSWFSSNGSMTDFADRLPELGDGIKAFGDSVAGINPENVKIASNAAKTIAQTAKSLPEDTGNLITFAENIAAAAPSFASYFSNIGAVTTESVDASNKVVKGLNSITGIKGDGIANIASAIDDFTNAVVNMTKNIGPDLNIAGSTAISEFVNGVEGKTPDAKAAFETMVSECKSAVTNEEMLEKFGTAGKNVVKGFAAGISENTYIAEAKARAMAKAAAEAAEEALDINSPSKVFYTIGDFTGLGFIKGLDGYTDVAYSSGANMANSAKTGLSDAISKIKNLISGDMDLQPTIRPVLDLSDVRAGANMLNNVFGSDKSIGVMANVGSIANSMKNQNGANTEVVSAINDLGKKLGTPSGDTYNINGITYEEGSAVADAIATIIRAAIVERRI